MATLECTHKLLFGCGEVVPLCRFHTSVAQPGDCSQLIRRAHVHTTGRNKNPFVFLLSRSNLYSLASLPIEHEANSFDPSISTSYRRQPVRSNIVYLERQKIQMREETRGTAYLGYSSSFVPGFREAPTLCTEATDRQLLVRFCASSHALYYLDTHVQHTGETQIRGHILTY